ncbi:D-Ala-D-Ala carboxypeptidase family metallohydrolase [Ahrensia sp. R2A130]|uniref:YcbK family protein n=1 Tax=Ahrensia sp. R2A130 TaxID=744979 RepID=UPI000590B1BD|nr:D-Ala-D-Ala carboxypeptidase family metallohydrolase [Ahrensia sp. R2A130]
MFRRVAILLILAFTLSGCASTPGLYKLFGKGEVKYQKTSWCLPWKLKRVLRRVAHNYGDVIVFSTWRSPWHNYRVGGASGSYHKKCKAVDFKVRGANMSEVYRYVKRQRGVGGHKLYPASRGGHIHIDTGPRRTWR